MALLKYQSETVNFEWEKHQITAVIGGVEIDDVFDEIFEQRTTHFSDISFGYISGESTLGSDFTLGDVLSRQFKVHKKVSRKRSLQAIEEILQFLNSDDIVNRRMGDLSELQVAHAQLANAIALRPDVVLVWKFLSLMSAPIRATIKRNIQEIHSELQIGFLLLEKRAAVVENLAQDVFNFHPEQETLEIVEEPVLPLMTPSVKASGDEISGLDFVSG